MFTDDVDAATNWTEIENKPTRDRSTGDEHHVMSERLGRQGGANTVMKSRCTNTEE